MKLTKLLLGSAIALPATITPLSTLTSCAQSWGHLSAMGIGGVFNNDGPYSSCVASNPLDYDGKPYAEYLQSNYTIKQSSNTPYAYSMPMKWDKTVGEHGDWVNGSNGWYGIGNSAFKSTASYTDGDEKKTSTNARNAALSSNISFISGIGLTLSNYLTQAFQYQSSQIDKDDEASVQYAWGKGVSRGSEIVNFKYGEGTKPSHPGSQLFDFYEFGFANANLNGAKKSSAMLRPSNINFKFSKFPLPSYEFNGSDRVDLSDDFITFIDPSVDPTASYSVEDFNYYTSCKKDLKDKDEDEYWTFKYDAVPIVVKINNITENYLNPRKSSSFLVNDYYSSDKQVLSTIGSQWKASMKKLTDCEAAEAVPHNKSFKLQADGIKFNYLDVDADADARLSNDDMSGSNFIALASYNVTIYKDSTKRNKNVAAMNGITGMLPAYWLDIYRNRTDWFKHARKNDENSPYIFNQKTVNSIASKFRGLIDRTSSEGRKRAKNTNEESKNLLGFLAYVFGNSSGVADTSIFLDSLDPIQHD